MTEESSADDADREPDADDADRAADADDTDGARGVDDAAEEPVDDDDLAPARSEEEPDVDAAREELEAIGRADEDDESDETETGVPTSDGTDDENELDDGEDSNGEPPNQQTVESPDGESADADGTAEEGEEPNPEDLVRDPDEPQVTSSLDAEEESADAEEASADADAESDGVEADAEADTGVDESDARDAESEAASRTPDDDVAIEAEPSEGESAGAEAPDATDNGHQPGVPDDVQKYDRFKKVDGSQYDRVNEFLRDRTYITAREWAIARLCSDFRTETGVEMTKIGNNLPELVPFMTDTYTPQAVNQARSSFEDKVRTAGATFLYGAMCDFFTAEELDDVMYEATEVAKFLLEVEGVELSVEDELEAEDRISAVMREVRSSSAELRHERCPECGAELTGEQ